MRSHRKNRNAFRPSIGGAGLEDRASSWPPRFGSRWPACWPQFVQAAAVNARQDLAATGQASAAVQTANTGSTLTLAQLRRSYLQQVRAASTDLRLAINAQAARLFANGQPTAQQLADFNAFVNGAINATTLRVSSLSALLPGSSEPPRAEHPVEPLLSRAPPIRGLMSRIQALSGTARNTTSATTLENAIGRAIDASTARNVATGTNFFATTPINRLSVDATTGQQIPLEQFLGQQVISQFGNSLGATEPGPSATWRALPLFADGATPTTEAQQQFAGQFSQALGVVSGQLATNLSLFPGSKLIVPQVGAIVFGAQHRDGHEPRLESGFGTGTTTGSGSLGSGLDDGRRRPDEHLEHVHEPLRAALNGLPTTLDGFNTGASTAFNTAFSNLATPLSSFFGLSGNSASTLPTSNFSNLFGTSFAGSNFFSGFNNGFGSGFVGFGQTPTALNTNFGTGFNNLFTGLNMNAGFSVPSFSDGSLGSGGFGTGTTTGSGSLGSGGFGTGTTTGSGSLGSGGTSGSFN